jgi:hypothetical protein
MLIEFLDGFDEITIERQGVLLGARRPLGHLERSEQPGDVTVVGQCPPQRWCHPVGMIGAKWVSLTGADGSHKIVQPDGSVVVVE